MLKMSPLGVVRLRSLFAANATAFVDVDFPLKFISTQPLQPKGTA